MVLTGLGKRDGSGDAPSGDRRSGKPLSSTFEAEAERLGAGRQACGPEVIRIKTNDALLEMISQVSARSLDMRLLRETRSGPRCRGFEYGHGNSCHHRDLPVCGHRHEWLRHGQLRHDSGHGDNRDDQ